MTHQPELLEHLERAVDGGGVDGADLAADVREHLVGGGVVEVLDCAQDELALRGEPKAALAQQSS